MNGPPVLLGEPNIVYYITCYLAEKTKTTIFNSHAPFPRDSVSMRLAEDDLPNFAAHWLYRLIDEAVGLGDSFVFFAFFVANRNKKKVFNCGF